MRFCRKFVSICWWYLPQQMLKIIIFYLCHFSKILVRKRNWGTEGWSNLLGGVASHHGRGGTRVYKPSDEAFGDCYPTPSCKEHTGCEHKWFWEHRPLEAKSYQLWKLLWAVSGIPHRMPCAGVLSRMFYYW